jgi:hypothetical protein
MNLEAPSSSSRCPPFEAHALANLVHLLGLVMLIGGIGIVDLRLIGFARSVPLAPLARFLTPVAIVGLALLVASGFFLFAADAGKLFHSTVFRWKVTVLSIAIVNVILFEALWGRRFGCWTTGPPFTTVAMAAASIGLWLLTATLGRLIAYF